MDPLKELAPGAFGALVRQNEVVMAEGALSSGVKELIAVALSLSTRREPCLRVHVGRARKARAVPEEVAETTVAATLKDGGMAYVWPKRTMAGWFPDEPTGD